VALTGAQQLAASVVTPAVQREMVTVPSAVFMLSVVARGAQSCMVVPGSGNNGPDQGLEESRTRGLTRSETGGELMHSLPECR
jgi:hypothetical protein